LLMPRCSVSNLCCEVTMSWIRNLGNRMRGCAALSLGDVVAAGDRVGGDDEACPVERRADQKSYTRRWAAMNYRLRGRCSRYIRAQIDRSINTQEMHGFPYSAPAGRPCR
jgi:hypothetical protein